MCVCVCVCVCVNNLVYVYVHEYVCVFFVRVCVCVCVCVHACMCVYTCLLGLYKLGKFLKSQSDSSQSKIFLYYSSVRQKTINMRTPACMLYSFHAIVHRVT